jgi:hypothetical protein
VITHRKKRGRPPFIWHGPRGEEFVRAVHNTWWQRRPITRSHAITIVLQRHEFAHLRRYSRRYLEKQLLNCREFWSLCRVRIREIKKPVGGPEFMEQKLDLVEQKIG